MRAPKFATLEIPEPDLELAESRSPKPKHGSLDEAESMLNEFVAITTGLAAVIFIIEKIMVWLNLARRLSSRNIRPREQKVIATMNEEPFVINAKSFGPRDHLHHHDDDREP